jgi:apolipoprotein N-acyltransferase
MAVTEVRTTTSTDDAPALAAGVPALRDRLGLAVLLALVSGGLATLAFPPVGWWPLIFVAFVPLAVAQHRVAPNRWGAAVFGLGLSAYLAGQLSKGLHEGDVAPVFELMPLYFGGIFALVAWRSRTFHTRTGYRWLWLSTPMAWTAIDFGRNLGALNALGGTWANPVYALYHHPVVLQPISVVGMYGLELLVLVVNFALATLVIRWIDGDPLPRRLLTGVGVALVVWTLLGAVLMDSGGARSVRVASIQTGTAGLPWELRLERDLAQTRVAAKQGAQIAIWSEGGLPFDPRVEHTAELKALAAETGMYIGVGAGYDDAQGRHHNEVMLLSPAGEFSEPYGKDHPGTFANDFSDAQGTYPVVKTPFGDVGSVICYDMDFTDTARKMTRNGARIIAAASSDVPAIAGTHYTHLVFRAIENRVSTFKGDKGFDSAIIDPWGRIQKSTVHPSGRGQATLVDTVPLGSGRSPFVSFGDYMGWLAMAAALGFVVYSAARTRKAAT